MPNNTKRYWFPAKRYGWGWGFPSSWQGRAVFIMFMAVVSIIPFIIDPNESPLLFLASMLGAAGILIAVCYAKGEPPKWRWGNSDAEKDHAEQDPP